MTREPKARKDAHLWVRDPHDWYVEEAKSVRQLLTVEPFDDWTHDPCCGGGNIVRELAAAGVTVTGADLIERGAPAFVGTSDFIATGWVPPGVRHICFNPPYYKAIGAEQCVVRALDAVPGKVAAFVSAKFLYGGKRSRRLYKARPPSRVWLLTDRPSCPPGVWLAAGNVAGGGEQDFAWLVWDPVEQRRPAGELAQVGWL